MAKQKDAFEKMVEALSFNIYESESSLLDSNKKDDLPVRLRIIAEAFAEGIDYESLDARLEAAGCEKLYARSPYEASFIFAFTHGLKYEEWKALYKNYVANLETSIMADKYFRGGKITLKQLNAYVYDNSDESLKTQTYTSFIRDEIRNIKDASAFEIFMIKNSAMFSETREKARYYFCKYILLYIQEKCQNYYDACEKTEQQRESYGYMLTQEERGQLETFALEELSFLKPLTELKREAQKKKASMSLDDKREMLENTALTPGGIFDEFNYYFFGYISEDWLELVFELYGGIQDWPEDLQIRIAHALGYCSMRPDDKERSFALTKLKEEEAALEAREDEKDAIYNDGGGYQRGRGGEDYFRSFLLGKRDINRESLISFLLFVKGNTKLSPDFKIDQRRINHILHNCGFAQLRPSVDFDAFAIAFLQSNDPFDIVEEHVDKQVTQGKNFYLYNVYKDAYCHSGELSDYLAYIK